MQRKFIFIRGLPASGKSTMAEHFKKKLSCASWDYQDFLTDYVGWEKRTLDALEDMKENNAEHCIFEAVFQMDRDFYEIFDHLTLEYDTFDAQLYVATHQGRPEGIAASSIERMRINFQSNEQVITGLRKKYPTVRFFDCSTSFRPPRRTQK